MYYAVRVVGCRFYQASKLFEIDYSTWFLSVTSAMNIYIMS